MDDFKSSIDFYIELNKDKSRFNKVEIESIISLIKGALDRDEKMVRETVYGLTSLHYSISAEFIKRVFGDLDEDVKKELISEFMRDDKVRKNNNNYGINRMLAMVNELLVLSGNSEYIHTLLKACTRALVDGKDNSHEALNKLCLEQTKDKLFLLDYSSWHEDQLRRFIDWAAKAVSLNDNKRVFIAFNNLSQKYIPSEGIEILSRGQDSKGTQDINFGENYENGNIRNNTIKSIKQLFASLGSEIDGILQEQAKMTLDINIKEDELRNSNNIREQLSQKLFYVQQENNRLQCENEKNSRRLQEFVTSLNEMEKRLKEAYRADTINSNQEVADLKNDLGKSIRLCYKDFRNLSQKSPSDYHLYYEGLVDIIENIFSSLHKKGIILQVENEG